MKIIAHRGVWDAREEGNTLDAFEKAFYAGFGIETDVRDYAGRLVISHNVATENSIHIEEVLRLYKSFKMNLPLALNVKSDGIQPLLKECLKEYDIENYFMFDMSVPELVVYVREGFHVFSRQSEYEKSPSFYEKAEGIWMDEFAEEWITQEIIDNHLENGKRLSIISSEIHGNSTDRLWHLLEKYKENESVMLCTDIPQEAEKYFAGK